MSSILDALRKLDEQKAVRKQRPVDLARELGRSNAAAPGIRVRPWQIMVAVVLVALASISVTLLLFRPAAQSPVTLKLPADPPRTPAAQNLPALSPPAATLPTSVLPAQKPAAKPAAMPAKASAPVTATPGSRPMIPLATPPPHVSPALETAPERQVVAAPAPAASPPALKVTGIGWQKDATARFAVINGTALSEGGTIDGARIEEILPDKVRVKIDGKLQEIGLGSK